MKGGWDPNATSFEDLKFPSDIGAQIDQAFANVDIALKEAGGKGWSQVFKVRSYHVGIDEGVTQAMVKNYKVE